MVRTASSLALRGCPSRGAGGGEAGAGAVAVIVGGACGGADSDDEAAASCFFLLAAVAWACCDGGAVSPSVCWRGLPASCASCVRAWWLSVFRDRAVSRSIIKSVGRACQGNARRRKQTTANRPRRRAGALARLHATFATSNHQNQPPPTPNAHAPLPTPPNARVLIALIEKGGLRHIFPSPFDRTLLNVHKRGRRAATTNAASSHAIRREHGGVADPNVNRRLCRVGGGSGPIHHPRTPAALQIHRVKSGRTPVNNN